jgi:1-acyl-sn-glycerol-3-phosphate acyltransferase
MARRKAEYSTEWARRMPSRAAREAILLGGLGPLIKLFGHPRVVGLENLAEVRPPAIFVANHSSHMDTPCVLLALPRRLRRRTLVLAAADHFYRNRVVGGMVTLAFGAVPLERQRPSLDTLRNVERLLHDGWNLLAFPEGTRSRDGRLYKGKTGIARIAMQAGVPVVPVGLRGTFQALPHDRKFPKRSRVEVRFGPPLTFDRHRDRPLDQFVLRSITDEIMYEIMMLSGQEYVDRYGDKPGRAGAEQAADRTVDRLEPGRVVEVRASSGARPGGARWR